MKTILVPTDFSDIGRNAAIYARELAREMKYNVLLFHVYNLPLSAPGEMPGAMMIDVSQLENDIRERLKEEAAFLSKNNDVIINWRTATGFVASEIIELEKKEKPSLIILGIRSTGAVSEFVFGSLPTDIIRKIHTPLIIVPENAKFKRIEKLVFANDHKIETDLLMDEPIKEFLEEFKSKVYVLKVESENGVSEEEKGLAEMRIEKYFQNSVHSYHKIENKDVIEGLNEFIDKNGIDMITMMPHKHNFAENLFKEGATKRMAFHTHVPLLSLSNQVFNLNGKK